MEQYKVKSLKELNRFAHGVLAQIKHKNGAQVFGLSGDLGSGKTALTKEFAKILGVEEEVTSPTFVVMKSYTIPSHELFKTLVHIDAYRIESDDEMQVLRFKELLDDRINLIVIEWPERIENILPDDIFQIDIEIIEGEVREITTN